MNERYYYTSVFFNIGAEFNMTGLAYIYVFLFFKVHIQHIMCENSGNAGRTGHFEALRNAIYQ